MARFTVMSWKIGPIGPMLKKQDIGINPHVANWNWGSAGNPQVWAETPPSKKNLPWQKNSDHQKCDPQVEKKISESALNGLKGILWHGHFFKNFQSISISIPWDYDHDYIKPWACHHRLQVSFQRLFLVCKFLSPKENDNLSVCSSPLLAANILLTPISCWNILAQTQSKYIVEILLRVSCKIKKVIS